MLILLLRKIGGVRMRRKMTHGDEEMGFRRMELDELDSTLDLAEGGLRVSSRNLMDPN